VTVKVAPEFIPEIHHDLGIVRRPRVMFLFHSLKEMAVVDHIQLEMAWFGEQFDMINYNKTLPKEVTSPMNEAYPQPNSINTSQ
jgi:hypothetical protein